MPGILYVVATPIGNLEDVTLRALRVLRDVSLIAAEDTRRTGRLLQHYSITTRTTSLHEHNEHAKTAKLIDRLRAGESIALVSDAGTPLISDPGQTLVAAAREAGIRVEPIPGASAVMTALAASGFPAKQFAFLGFPPTRSNDRRAWFEALRGRQELAVFFEAPHRIRRTLDDLATVFGPEHEVGVGRELTKAHEELVIKPISDIISRFTDPKGEFTVLVPPAMPLANPTEAIPSDEKLRDELGLITKNGGLRGRAALKVLADRYGMPVNDLYARLTNTSPGGQKT
jgi:16S rRNA (cytidine1402-2'-O)-methyltransferase